MQNSNQEGCNTIQLTNILANSPVTRSFTRGVHSADYCPEFTSFPCLFIWNTAPKNSKGLHWVAVYVEQKNKCYYFDSAGAPIPLIFRYHLSQFRIRHVLSKAVQSPFSTVCGQYCIMFLHWVCSGKSPQSFCRTLFTENLNSNDEKVEKWFNALVMMM